MRRTGRTVGLRRYLVVRVVGSGFGSGVEVGVGVICRSWENVGMGLPNLLMFDRASRAALLMTSTGDLEYHFAFLPVTSVNIAYRLQVYTERREAE